MTTDKAQGSVEERTAEALANAFAVWQKDANRNPFYELLNSELAACNLKIVEMKDGE